MLKPSPFARLRKRAKRGFRGYPAGTVAFYGPTAEFASKVAVGIIAEEGGDADPLKRWFSTGMDVRTDHEIGAQVAAFLAEHGARTVIVTKSIIGCPHEEGIDYPDGSSCPQCPYWAGRDRFAGEDID